ncbi:MAG: SDR family NAD(P)-dependent oxidoreductase [Deltaproteobacteria bacterium]|nr:SDR family NAD(P)-dependent oxidoreductase [Deltaproteobacteria bacterium]
MATSGPTTTTEDVLAGVDLAGKRVLVTGASGGLGLETARALASHGAEVILAARDAAKTDAALRTIREQVPDAKVSGTDLDLASLASVRACAARLRQQLDRLDLLINNAGVMACPLARTADGFELQFGTNHLGHFLFTGLLVPLLVTGAPARVVNLSSDGHMLSDVHWDDPSFERHDYEKWASYGQSKTANVLFSVELERRLGKKGVHAWAVHPGMIMTDLGRHLTADDVAMLQSMTKGRGEKKDGESSGGGGRAGGGMPGFKTIPQGAATSVWAATAPELEGRGGGYLADCTEATKPKPWALDAVSAGRLWAISEKMVGETFAF